MLGVGDYNLGKEKDTERCCIQYKWQVQWPRGTGLWWSCQEGTLVHPGLSGGRQALMKTFSRWHLFQLMTWKYFKVVEKCFAYKIVSFYLVLFLMMISSVVITSWYKHVYSFWDHMLKQHYNTTRCIKVLKNTHYIRHRSSTQNLSQRGGESCTQRFMPNTELLKMMGPGQAA